MDRRPPLTFDTARLRLRPPSDADAPVVFAAWAQDREVTRYLTWRPHATVDESRAFLLRCEAAWRERTAFPWAIEIRESGQLVGMVEMRLRGPAADIGYVLARPCWGAGYMTEAAGAVVEWAIAQPTIYRVWATCDVENVASARVLERLGMHLEGVLRRWIIHPNVDEAPRDSLCYARVK